MLSDFVEVRHLSVLDHVSMHLLVLSAFRLGGERGVMFGAFMSQCTFWCSVLSDDGCLTAWGARDPDVSMHLLVLSAFRRGSSSLTTRSVKGLNAPSGAQCFPTE